MNLEKYFAAPIFHSRKSTYTLHYQNELERKLMEHFDVDVEVKDFFQPLMAISAMHENKECSINIDFWLEYRNGHSGLLHIENENSFMEQTQRKAFECSVSLDGFSLIVFTAGRWRQPRIKKLKYNFPLPEQYYSKWLN